MGGKVSPRMREGMYAAEFFVVPSGLPIPYQITGLFGRLLQEPNLHLRCSGPGVFYPMKNYTVIVAASFWCLRPWMIKTFSSHDRH